MIEDVQTVSVPVSNQERARDFYVGTLGFELRADNPWGEGMRWVEVAPAGSGTSLSLVTWFEAMPPGSLQGLVLASDDVQRAYRDLSARGVEFASPPTEMPGGTQAVFQDPDGNGFVLWQR